MERDYPGPDSRRVQKMFAGIAHRYDFLNHFLSASIDRRWRRIAVHKVRELIGSSPSTVCLDVCSGTGDLALALHHGTHVVTADNRFVAAVSRPDLAGRVRLLGSR